jgi:hypothetical protein
MRIPIRLYLSAELACRQVDIAPSSRRLGCDVIYNTVFLETTVRNQANSGLCAIAYQNHNHYHANNSRYLHHRPLRP